MIELWQFIFSSPWVYLGTLVYLLIFLTCCVALMDAGRRR